MPGMCNKVFGAVVLIIKDTRFIADMLRCVALGGRLSVLCLLAIVPTKEKGIRASR